MSFDCGRLTVLSQDRVDFLTPVLGHECWETASKQQTVTVERWSRDPVDNLSQPEDPTHPLMCICPVQQLQTVVNRSLDRREFP